MGGGESMKWYEYRYVPVLGKALRYQCLKVAFGRKVVFFVDLDEKAVSCDKTCIYETEILTEKSIFNQDIKNLKKDNCTESTDW